MPTLKPGRELTELGEYGVKRQLQVMRNGPAVFWSQPRCNSYVAVELNGKLRIVSINGIGEIRWYVEDWNTDSESNEARDYFLEGWR